MQVVLADYAVTHDGKVMMAGAGWSQVGSGPFASALAFIVKVPWDMANQQIAIHAELVDEDGRRGKVGGHSDGNGISIFFIFDCGFTVLIGHRLWICYF
jgi:hypothetical protein